jgi:hypothetical protein
LDIFATVYGKQRTGQRRSRFMRYGKINSNRFKLNLRVWRPRAELKKPSNAKELHGQTELIAPIASKRISGVSANREFGRLTALNPGDAP